MPNLVIDAIAGLQYLLRTDKGVNATNLIEKSTLIAPSVTDYEVLALVRTLVRRGQITETRSIELLDDLHYWMVARINHRRLMKTSWEYSQYLNGYESFYIATAKIYGCPLLTTNTKYTRIPEVDIKVLLL